jgi:hypothetical protein
MNCRHSIYNRPIEFVSERLLKFKYRSDMESFAHCCWQEQCVRILTLDGSNEISRPLAACKAIMWHVSPSNEQKGAKELRLPVLGLSLHRNKSQVVTNHEICRVYEASPPNPHEGRSVEPQIRYIRYQRVLGASTAPELKRFVMLNAWICVSYWHICPNKSDIPTNSVVRIYLYVHVDEL